MRSLPLMEPLSVERCRELIGDAALTMSNEDVVRQRRELYELAGVVVDAFESLETVDQALLSPSADMIDQINDWQAGRRP